MRSKMWSMATARVAAVAVLGFVVAMASTAAAQGLGVYDPDLAWPLCGRIADAPPPGWNLGMPCPADRFGDPAFHDGPISSSFGPRQLPSEAFRYDFHRGIDLPADVGTPLFAIADGEVMKAGPHPGFTDPVIEIRHLRPGFGTCAAGGGCYTSMYLHVSAWTVGIGAMVSKGDYIGQTGVSSSGFAHLHFEIRDAPPDDPVSSWQKEAVHPLGALPYPDTGADNIDLHLDTVDTTDPLHPIVAATVTIPMGIDLDLEGLEVQVWERQPGDGLVAVPQPGDVRVGTTIEGDGYAVSPPFYSMNLTSRQYTYKDGSGIGYEEFLSGGLYESPYADLMPLAYDPGFHLDAADPGDFQVGLFNGMRIAPIHYNDESPAYQATFRFGSLVGTADAAALCIKVRALDARGNATPWQTFNCPGHSCPLAPRMDCRAADHALVQLTMRNGNLDRVKWTAKGGPATVLGDFGNPVGSDTTTYSWCLWDGAGLGAAVVGMDVPTGGTCGGVPCWKPRGTKGFKFKNRLGQPGGVIGMSLTAGGVGFTSLKVIGKGANLPAATLPLTAPMTVQLIADDGLAPVCWEAVYPTTLRNDTVQVKAKQ